MRRHGAPALFPFAGSFDQRSDLERIMGFRICWLAIRGKSREQILSEAGFSASGEAALRPFEKMYTGMDLGRRGYLIAIDDGWSRLLSNRRLKALSAGCEVIACAVVESVMFSFAASWRDGASVWEVDHRGENGLRHLRVTGAPPGYFTAIADNAARRQDLENEDDACVVDWYFEVPCLMAWRRTGFKHDRGYGLGASRSIEALDRRWAYWWR